MPKASCDGCARRAVRPLAPWARCCPAEPISTARAADPASDPFLTIGRRATPSRKAGRGTRKKIVSFMAANDVLGYAGFPGPLGCRRRTPSAGSSPSEQLARKGRRFLTTDYILDETVMLLLVRHSHAAAADFLQKRYGQRIAATSLDHPRRFHAAAAFFARHDDKKWSFTDWHELQSDARPDVRDSFTTDQHFRQAGFNPLHGKAD